MRILLVGHNSMIGKRIYERFAVAHHVMRVGRDREADYFLDLANCDTNSFQTIEPADVLIHAAASFENDTADGCLRNEIVNSVGAIQVTQMANKANCRQLIYLSSLSIYDNSDNQYFGSYGLSKRHAQENLVFLCNQLGIKLAALVLPQIYDEFGEARKHQGLLYSILEQAKDGKDFCITGGVDPLRNFLFVENLVDIIERVAESSLDGIFPTVHPQSHKLSEIVAMAYRVYGSPLQLSFDASRHSMKTVYIPQDFNLYHRIQYEPKTDLETGLCLIRQSCVGFA